jgi:galacturan 1,4-alpha-galacturonidase
MMLLRILPFVASAAAYVVNNGTECYVFPESTTHGGQPVDDTPSILQAFDLCGINGSVILSNETFHVNQVMNTTNLLNCDVSIYGELIWSTNIPYWLSHSYPVVFQNLYVKSHFVRFGAKVTNVIGLLHGSSVART